MVFIFKSKIVNNSILSVKAVGYHIPPGNAWVFLPATLNAMGSSNNGSHIWIPAATHIGPVPVSAFGQVQAWPIVVIWRMIKQIIFTLHSCLISHHSHTPSTSTFLKLINNSSWMKEMCNSFWRATWLKSKWSNRKFQEHVALQISIFVEWDR